MPNAALRITTPILVTAAGVIILGGCVGKKRSEPLPQVDTRPMVDEIRQAALDWAWVSSQDWVLSSIEGSPPIAETQPWIRFRAHTWLEGGAGCNRFTASYERKAEAGLSVSQIISTRMFCSFPEGVMQQEARLFHMLQSIDSYHAEPDRFDLLADGAVMLSFVIERDEGAQTPESSQP